MRMSQTGKVSIHDPLPERYDEAKIDNLYTGEFTVYQVSKMNSFGVCGKLSIIHF